MNADQTTPTTLPSLPELSDERIDEIETALFARIGADRVAHERSARRRRTGWIAGAAAAAAVVIAVAIAPTVGGLVGVRGAGGSAVAPDAPQVAPEAGGDSDAGALVDGAESSYDESQPTADDAADREIIATASATVRVDDIPAAVAQIGSSAEAAGGYVESMSVGKTGGLPGEEGMVYDEYTQPYSPTAGGWITVRVPADELPAVIAQLAQVGDVEASQISRQDVTTQAIDLRARVEAMQASVDRLTALLAEAEDVSDLIAAESALADRQAMLESYQAELEYLEDQVAMSTLSVSVLPKTETVEADPAGFADGLAAGWNGLVATLNGIVIAIGFLIPWILVVGVVALIVWGIVRLVRRRRAARKADAAAPRDAAADAGSGDGDGES